MALTFAEIESSIFSFIGFNSSLIFLSNQSCSLAETKSFFSVDKNSEFKLSALGEDIFGPFLNKPTSSSPQYIFTSPLIFKAYTSPKLIESYGAFKKLFNFSSIIIRIDFLTCVCEKSE